MPTAHSETKSPVDEAGVLQFARAFRAAARAVGFYPEGHPAVVSSLEQIVRAARPLTTSGSICLTVLPGTFLAGGVPIESTESVVADLAGILHRHGVGSLRVNAAATGAAWGALLGLLARSPEEVQAAGGIGCQWKNLRHASPVILEIDFGELLRGRVGGDFVELAGVISHYLETGGVETTTAAADNVREAIERALESGAAETEVVDAILNELRRIVYLGRVIGPECAEEMLKQATALAGRFPAPIMAGLLARRGTAEACVGTTDVVAAFVERVTDRAVAEFLMNAVAREGPLGYVSDLISNLAPDRDRRQRIMLAVQRSMGERGALKQDFLARWAEIERDLESYTDAQYVSSAYARELGGARARSAESSVRHEDPPERVAAWMRTIDDGSVDDLDLKLLLDLARLETDAARWPNVLAILSDRLAEAATAGDWALAAAMAEAIAQEASEGHDAVRRRLSREALHKLAQSDACTQALAGVASGLPSGGDGSVRLLLAVGPALVPAIARRYADETGSAVRDKLADLVAGYGRDAGEALKYLLRADSPELRSAAVRLLHRIGATEHLPGLEPLLADANLKVRREALHALATAESDRAREVLARAFARADEPQQRALIEPLIALGDNYAVPALRALLTQTDQRAVARPVYLSIIERLGHARTDEAVAALGLVFEQTRWRAPWRALAFRSAAIAALRRMNRETARAALVDASVFGRSSTRQARPRGPGRAAARPGSGDNR